MIKKSLLLLSLFALLFISCSKDDDNPINSGTYGASGKIITTEGSVDYKYGAASYDEDDNETFVMLADNETIFGGSLFGSNYIGFYFDGRSTGTYNLGENAGLVLNGSLYASISGTITITKYGQIGDYVEGSITGKFVSMTGTTLDITSSNFKVKLFDDDDFDDDEYDDDNYDDYSSDVRNFKLSVTNEGNGSKYNFSGKAIDESGMYVDFNLQVASMGFTLENSNDKTLGCYGTLGNVSQSKKTYSFDNEEVSFLWTIEELNDDIFTLDGKVTIDEWKNSGQMIKVKLEGKLRSIGTGTVLNIVQFEFEIKRIY